MYTLSFKEINKHHINLVGGKALNLGILSNNDFNVPNGFVLTSQGFKALVNSSSKMETYYMKLERLKTKDIRLINTISKEIFSHILSLKFPSKLLAELNHQLSDLNDSFGYAIRSSATAEDLPGNSFAGQHDSYLNVKGFDNILYHIKKCIASLFTERAIYYRIQNGFKHKDVSLCVIIQETIPSFSSGVLFTADPISGNRKTSCINAVYGLGESLVQGITSCDYYKVKKGEILEKKLEEQSFAMYCKPDGGIIKRNLGSEECSSQVLFDSKIIELYFKGKSIEHFFNTPQDIEWTYYNGEFYILQSRDITTLYPLPQIKDDFFHIYMSFGHQQMMTNAISPLGLCILKYFLPIRNKKDPLCENSIVTTPGNRIYTDMTAPLKTPFF